MLLIWIKIFSFSFFLFYCQSASCHCVVDLIVNVTRSLIDCVIGGTYWALSVLYLGGSHTGLIPWREPYRTYPLEGALPDLSLGGSEPYQTYPLEGTLPDLFLGRRTTWLSLGRSPTKLIPWREPYQTYPLEGTLPDLFLGGSPISLNAWREPYQTYPSEELYQSHRLEGAPSVLSLGIFYFKPKMYGITVIFH